MNNPKRNHFVPEMVSRRFADDSGRLFFFNKQFPEKGVLATTPKNLFVVGHLYTQLESDGTKDVSVERTLAALESVADQIIKKIVTAARAGQEPNLTTDEKEIWDQFFFNQWKRVPDSHERSFTYSEFEEFVRTSLEKFETLVRPLTAEEREKMNDPKELARIRQNARARMVAKPGGETVKMLGSKGLLVAIIARPNKSFIIGSRPVVKLNYPGRAHFADPSVEVWFPLAHDVAVTPGLSQGTEKLAEMNEDRDIRGINEAIFKQSTAIAGRSPALVASLAGVRYRTWLPT
jgi:hypothetical protein